MCVGTLCTAKNITRSSKELLLVYLKNKTKVAWSLFNNILTLLFDKATKFICFGRATETVMWVIGKFKTILCKTWHKHNQSQTSLIKIFSEAGWEFSPLSCFFNFKTHKRNSFLEAGINCTKTILGGMTIQLLLKVTFCKQFCSFCSVLQYLQSIFLSAFSSPSMKVTTPKLI